MANTIGGTINVNANGSEATVLPGMVVTLYDPDRVWPRFKAGDGSATWIDPVTRDMIALDDEGELYVKGSSIGCGQGIAEVARKLGVVLEGVNDGARGEDEKAEEPRPLEVGQRWASPDGIKVKVVRFEDWSNGRRVYYRFDGHFSDSDHDEGTFRRVFPIYIYPGDTKPDEAAESPETSPVPLAVGQVWESGCRLETAEIEKITEDRVCYVRQDDLRCSRTFPEFQHLFPTLISPAPETPVPLAVGQVWAGPGFGSPVTIIEVDDGEVGFRQRNSTDECWWNEGMFRETFPTLVSPAPDTPVPLAVGQVWMDVNWRSKVEITKAEDGVIHYRYIPPHGGFSDCCESTFRVLFPQRLEVTSKSPAPPSRDDLINLLVSGKRLRFERDPASDCRGPWEELKVHLAELNGTHRGVFVAKPIECVLNSPLSDIGSWVAAQRSLILAEQLGYRFAEVVD